eukprot:TRINITY_DN5385_c0_g1_i1.p1 TRINITY_DN5385_c0_g1~~TRINITY_DN5385_c0_g1_i1.p1  ORF type:complete len:183 (-),score=38.17 TRINITY_DN5385_c0_g1_i1:19-567(-)
MYTGYYLHHVLVTSPARSKFYGYITGLVVFFIFVLQLLPMLYFSMFHQAAPIDVMTFLRTTTEPVATDVAFLTPCHSTPYHAYVHRTTNEQPITMKFLDCSPSDDPQHVEEAEQFKADPRLFTDAYFDAGHHPTHIVLFDNHQRVLAPTLAAHGYSQCASFLHDPLQRRRLVVMCSSKSRND